MTTATDLIERLELAPHPEGGWYRRVHTGTHPVTDASGMDRPGLTLIYYLLERGSHSAWHRIDADEVWHAVAGDDFTLWTLDEGRPKHRRITPGAGPDSMTVVPGGVWQAAEVNGEWALATCIVGPGFDFSGFALLRDHPDSHALLATLDAALRDLA